MALAGSSLFPSPQPSPPKGAREPHPLPLAGEGRGEGLPRSARWALIFVMLSVTVFSRLGVRVGEYPVDMSFIALYVLLGTMLWQGWARFDTLAFVLYGLGVSAATVSLLVSDNFDVVETSTGSLALLVAIYLPFAFALRPPGDTQAAWQWTVRMFGNVALLCALAGIVQFFAQFVIEDPWLFKYNQLLPWRLQGAPGYNTVIPVGELYKSNGFFLREPSHFSFLMALALVMELQSGRRVLRLAAFGLALLLTYSGTGLLALALGLMFPLGRRTLVTMTVAAVCGAFVVLVLGEVLNLQFTLNRLAEFGSERSSAYARYVKPVLRLADEIDVPSWAVFIGHGPGTIQRSVRGENSFDPTWAKLLYEYGMLGFIAIVGLVGYCLTRMSAPSPMRVVLFMGWLVMGGYLLAPENCAMLYLLLCGWPAVKAGEGTGRIVPD